MDGWAVGWDGDVGRLAERVASRMVDGTERYYPSIQAAVDVSTGSTGNPDTVTVLADHEISDANKVTVPGGTRVRFVPVYGSNEIKLTQANGFGAELFTVQNGASLMLEGSGANKLIIDGGSNENITAQTALVTVDGGTFTMNAGATLQNNEPPRRRAAGY